MAEVVLTERELRRLRAKLAEAEVPPTYLGTYDQEWKRLVAEALARRPVLRVVSGVEE